MIYVKTLKPWTLNLPLRKGLGQGVLTGIIASILFAIFVFIYTNLLDPEFMQSIIENEPFGSYLNPYIAAVAVAIEGIASRFNPRLL